MRIRKKAISPMKIDALFRLSFGFELTGLISKRSQQRQEGSAKMIEKERVIHQQQICHLINNLQVVGSKIVLHPTAIMNTLICFNI